MKKNKKLEKKMKKVHENIVEELKDLDALDKKDFLITLADVIVSDVSNRDETQTIALLQVLSSIHAKKFSDRMNKYINTMKAKTGAEKLENLSYIG